MPTDPMPPPARARALAEALRELLAPPDPVPEPPGQPPPGETREPEAPSEWGRRQAARLASAAARALDAEAVGVLLVDDQGATLAYAGSDERATSLCDVESRAGEGPALDCTRQARSLAVRIQAVPVRWPDWTRTAARQGWALAQAVPIRGADRAVGGMVLLIGPDPGHPPRGSDPDGEPDLLWANLLADTAGATLAHDRALREALRRADQLQTALTSRVLIEQAKGVLAERGGIDVQTAFDRMRRFARAERRRLVDVAQEVVEGEAADAVLTHVRPLPRPPSILEP